MTPVAASEWTKGICRCGSNKKNRLGTELVLHARVKGQSVPRHNNVLPPQTPHKQALE